LHIPAVLHTTLGLVALGGTHNLRDSAVDNDLLLTVRVAQVRGQLPFGTRSTAWHQGAGESECLLSGHDDTSLTRHVARTVAAGILVQPRLRHHGENRFVTAFLVATALCAGRHEAARLAFVWRKTQWPLATDAAAAAGEVCVRGL
jgi:hypothetical protein